MARRKRKSDDSGLGGLLFIAIKILGFVLAGLLLMLRAALTVGFLGFPLAAAAGWALHAKVRPTPPPLTDPAAFDPREATRTVSRLLAERASWQAVHRQQHDQGEAKGIKLTQGSGGTRFDARSGLGRELNRRLEEAERTIDGLETDIQNARWEVSHGLPPWRADFDAWTRLRALALAWRAAVLLWPPLVGCLYLDWYLRAPKGLGSLQGVLIWNPWPSAALGPLVAGTLASYAVFGAALLFNRRSLPGLMDRDIERRWTWLESKWGGDFADVEEFFGPAPSGTRPENPPSTPAETASWQEVLGVPPGASPEEIRAAYRERVKAYHSDRVASLGQKLRDLADEESKRINVAYGEAKAALGFS